MRHILAATMLCVTAAFLLPPPVMAGEINLFVAASLREVMNELSDSYARTHPDISFRKNYGGSGTLAKQIENGAPADIFIAANTEWLEYLKSKNVVSAQSIAHFSSNVLVFAGRPELRVGSLMDLVRLEKIAIGSPKSVPAGEYAMGAIQKAGIGQQLAGKLVMAKDVRECLMYAERGEVDGAFVYRTDALQLAKNVRILFTVPKEYSPRVTYAMTLTNAGARNRDAVAFYAVLKSAQARAVLKKHGFIVQ
jgi:molybdate transport system substrate-binding protein